MPNLSQCFKK